MTFESAGSSPKRENPEQFIERFEQSRIQVDEDFRSLYTDFESDMQRTEQLEAAYSNSDTTESLGKIAEGLVFSLMSEGRVGEHLDFRATHPYDDYCHGVDVIVEPKRKSLPALATFDITINQEDIKWRERRGADTEDIRPSGLEGKLERSKRYIDRLSRFSADEARELVGWIESGGLHEKHTKQNAQLFKKAEEVLLVKYYRTPESSNEPNRPGPVIGGPRSIISIDTVFINRALQGNERAKEMIRAISFLEFSMGISAEQAYLQGLARRQPQRNFLFDKHYAKVDAWSRILQQPELQRLVQTFLQEQKNDTDFHDQLSYYRKVLGRSFGI